MTKIRIPLPGGGQAVYNGGTLAKFNHPDWQGNIRVASKATTQTLAGQNEYTPFGMPYNNGTVGAAGPSFNQSFGDVFDSHEYDALNRELHPTQGRWIQPDPAGLSAVDQTNPQSWNRYAYVGNNPLSFIDPFGLECINITDGNGNQVTGDDGQGSECHTMTEGSGQPDAVSNTDVSQIPTFSDFQEFFAMWDQGTGPSSIVYGPNDGATKQLENSYTVGTLRNAYVKQGCPNMTNSKGSGHFGPWLNGYGSLATPNQNWTLMQVGGFSFSGSTTNNVTTFTITNGATNSSFTGRTTWAPIVNSAFGTSINPTGNNNPAGPNGPKHNIEQTFQWTEQGLCGNNTQGGTQGPG
jgi:RHS repeat-associated protein